VVRGQTTLEGSAEAVNYRRESDKKNRQGRHALGPQYDVTIITVRPGTQPFALARLKETVADAPGLLACWYSEIGTLNQILLLRASGDPAAVLASRTKLLTSGDPFGVGEWTAGMTMDIYVAFDFLPPVKPGKFGPCYEVRTYGFKTDGLAPTVDLWRKAVPGRTTVSPLLTAMTSVTGTVSRFMHIWPYTSLDERARLRAKAVANGVWPPPGGPSHLAGQQSDVYLPASFSPLC
jgi:hypothetical protein